jgi:uncharacterized membrane protein
MQGRKSCSLGRFFATLCLALPASAHATSQGPVADGPYVGTLPCADCAGLRTSLTLYTVGQGGLPLVYRMTRVYLGTPAADRGEEYLGPWSRIDAGVAETVRIEPQDDSRRLSFRRVDADRIVLLDRSEHPIGTRQDLALVRDPGAQVARLSAPRTLFRGTLRREAGKLQFAPCGSGKPVDARDVSPASVITAAITDAGFDARGEIHLEAWGARRDGELQLERLNRAGHDPACPTSAFGFAAQGDAPFWRVESDRHAVRFTGEGGESLHTPPLPLSWHWPVGRPDRADAVLASATESAKLRLRLFPKICRDASNGTVHGFGAALSVTRAGLPVEYTGCGHLGNEALY